MPMHHSRAPILRPREPGPSSSQRGPNGAVRMSAVRCLIAFAFGCWLPTAGTAGAQGNAASVESIPVAAAAVRHGRELLQEKHFAEAKIFFGSYLRGHAADRQAALGLGDAELGLRQYEAAEATYRALVAQQPELWAAHKNLVVVEAALGRWDDFDGERKILRLARERGAAGISATESDLIDTLTVDGQRWLVRAYFEPLGRSRTLYNFERFGPNGRIEAYVSLEDAFAAQAALRPGDVRIGDGPGASPSVAAGQTALALNWYTGTAHGGVRRYAKEPRYQQLRADVLRWLRSRPVAMRGSLR